MSIRNFINYPKTFQIRCCLYLQKENLMYIQDMKITIFKPIPILYDYDDETRLGKSEFPTFRQINHWKKQLPKPCCYKRVRNDKRKVRKSWKKLEQDHEQKKRREVDECCESFTWLYNFCEIVPGHYFSKRKQCHYCLVHFLSVSWTMKGKGQLIIIFSGWWVCS